MSRKSLFAAGASLLTLLTLVGLAACGDDPPPLPQASVDPAAGAAAATAVSVSARSGSAALPPLGDGIPDVSGCWRTTGSDGFASGNQIDILRVSADAFVFAGPPARTKLVFTPERSFSEVNFDDAHPFFAKDYIHSTGIVSADGKTLSRTIEGQASTPQTLHRCETVQERPFTPVGSETPKPGASGPIDTGSPDAASSASPKPIILPSNPPSASATAPSSPPSASPASSSAPPDLPPGVKPTTAPTPKPSQIFKPIATPTPRPSITPKPTALPADSGIDTPEGSQT